MKTRILSMAICMVVALLSSSILIQDISAKAPKRDEDYAFEGTWDAGRRSIILDPITGSMSNGIFCVTFKFASPNATIVVSKDGVIVEQIDLSTPAGHNEFIDLNPYGKGDYNISITNPFGNHVWCDFSIEE